MENDASAYKDVIDEGAESDQLEFDELVAIHNSPFRLESATESEFMARFKPFFDTLGSRFFSAHEFAFLGPNNTGEHKCVSLNVYPKELLWVNLERLVPALDSIREELGHPIGLSSIYRAQGYNTCVGGVENSQHRKFTAADCVVGAVSPMLLYNAAKRVRERGMFKGGIGLYNTFVHIDVRGINADWSKVPT